MVDALQAKRSARFDGGAPRPERDGEPLAKALATRATTPVTPPSAAFSRALNGRVVAIFPRLSSLADRITVEDIMLDERSFVTKGMAPYGLEPVVEMVGIEPGEAEIAHAVKVAGSAGATILFLYDAHLYPSNRALLDALQKAAKDHASERVPARPGGRRGFPAFRHMLHASGIPPRPISSPSRMRIGFGKSGSHRARPMAKTKPAQTGSSPLRRIAKATLNAPTVRNSSPRRSTTVIGPWYVRGMTGARPLAPARYSLPMIGIVYASTPKAGKISATPASPQTRPRKARGSASASA